MRDFLEGIARRLNQLEQRLSQVERTEPRQTVRADGVITASSAINNSTTETTLYTESIAAGILRQGHVVKVRILGRYSTANGTDTFTARLKVGGTTIDTIISDAANVTNAPFDIEFMFTVRTTGASGTLWGYASAEFNNTSKSVADAATSTLNTTAADDVTLTVQWSAANAGNSVSVDQAFTEFLG